jgi:ubiquinone/menaquinone biosynthesis C-methylase UbiE
MQNLDALYRFRFSASEKTAKEAVWRVLCEHFFQRWIQPDAVVLEIACGFGEFISSIHAKRKIAIDLNPDAPEFLPSEIEFHLADASNMDFLESSSIDICFTSNFFEHLPSKSIMDQVLAEIRRILKPGGRLMALQPNIRYAYNLYWDYYDHYLPLSHLSCAEAFAKSAFEVEYLIPRFLPFTTKSSLPKHPLLVKTYLRIPLLWRLMGKQFFILARKL